MLHRLGVIISNAEESNDPGAMSTMTAVGADESSRSSRKSGSIGRHCRSVFATVIINKMMEVDESRRLLGYKVNGDEEEEGTTYEQEDSNTEFRRSVYTTLLEDVDRRGYEHTTTSIAQDDAGSAYWREGTAIPLTASRNDGTAFKFGKRTKRYTMEILKTAIRRSSKNSVKSTLS